MMQPIGDYKRELFCLMSEIVKNSHNNVTLSADEISMPKPNMLERLVGKHFRKKGEKVIEEAIETHAMTEDGRIDNVLADNIRKELTRRTEVSLHRDVLEPTSWAVGAGAIMGGTAIGVSKYMEGKAITPVSAMVAVSSVTLGACLDIYRVKRRFDSGMNGALSGALRAVKEARTPRWSHEEAYKAEQARSEEMPEERRER